MDTKKVLHILEYEKKKAKAMLCIAEGIMRKDLAEKIEALTEAEKAVLLRDAKNDEDFVWKLYPCKGPMEIYISLYQEKE